MAIQLIELWGGVVIPGTAYIEHSEEYGAEYEVVAAVFDTDGFPYQRVERTLVTTPYFSVAACTCALANTGVAPNFDLKEILPTGPVLGQVFNRNYHASLVMEI